MKNIIEKLYYGQMHDSEQIFFKNRKKREKQANEEMEIYDKIEQTFSEEDKKLFMRFDDLNGKRHGEELSLVYARGFKVGFWLAMELLGKDPDED